jgi:hypothetical protein
VGGIIGTGLNMSSVLTTKQKGLECHTKLLLIFCNNDFNKRLGELTMRITVDEEFGVN